MLQSSVSEFQIVVKAFSYLRTHWWVFLTETIVLVGLSLLNYARTEPIFESNGSILIDSSRRQLYQSVVMPGSGGGGTRKQNVVYLLTGQEVFERFRSRLTDSYNAEGRPAYLRQFFPQGVAVPAEILRTKIAFSADKASDIFRARCVGSTPETAYMLCLTYLDTIQTFYPEVGQRDTMMKRDFLSRQIASLTRQLAEREYQLSEFQKRNDDFINFLMLNIEGKGLQRLRSQALDLRQRLASNRALKRLLLDVPKAKRGEHTILGASITALSTRLSELRYQLTLQLQSMSVDRPQRLKSLETEIQSIESQLAKLNDEEELNFLRNPIQAQELRQRLSGLELEYRTDGTRLKDVEREITDIQVKEKRFQQQRLEHDRLQAELIHKRKLLANLFQKEQETELEMSAGSAEVYRLSEPTRKGAQIEPIFSKNLWAGVSGSLLMMIATVIILIATLPRIDSENDVYRMNLPVLGKIPTIRRGGSQSSLDDLPSFGLEFLKIMNYRILRETKNIRSPVIVINSPHSREGKSTVASFLALSALNPNKKTLLIDGDMLTAHPNKFFGFEDTHTPGLRAVMESANPPHPSTIIVKTIHEGLWFMPRGGRIDPVATPNYLKPLEKYLEGLRNEYEMIYIDTPPLFASNLAHQFCGLGDLIILVARLYFTRPKDIVEAIQTCKIFSRAPVGVALNCLPMSAQQKRASHYYFSKGQRGGGNTKLAA